MKHSLSASQTASCAFGILILVIGIINSFWGNDPIFGVGLMALSTLYIPYIQVFVEKKARLQIPSIAKIILGLVIIWAALGVGELFAKIKLMQLDLGSAG